MARYWVGGSGNVSDDTNHWATTSGGSPGAGNLPTSADDVFFDANSHSSFYTVTFDATLTCHNMTWAAPASGAVTWGGSGTSTIYGSLTLSSTMSLTGSGTLTFAATDTGHTITSNGRTQNKSYTFDGVGGGWTIVDTFNIGTGRNITLTNGSLILDNQTITASMSSNNANTRSLSAVNANITCVAWTFTDTTNLTSNLSGSTITFRCNVASPSSNTFNGGGLTYNNLVLTSINTGFHLISQSNTFADITAGTGMPGKTIKFTAGTTQTVTTFNVSGTAGNEITINSNNTSTHALTKAGGGTISCDYLNIQHSVASPANTWYAGANSTDNQATASAGSGWIFTAPPGGGSVQPNHLMRLMGCGNG